MSSDGPFKNPTPTVDCLIELEGKPGTLVFIERKNPPLGWAIPGGFVDEGEWIADACAREAKEETNLDVEIVELFGVYSNPQRDPRKHTVSTVFIARAKGTPTGFDDAVQCIVCRPDELPGKLVFDHDVIVGDYLEYKKSGKRPPPRR